MDATSKTFGVGDRYHWAWKLIDFPNGTYQSAVHGLSLLLVHKMLPNFISEQEILNRIHTIVIGINNIIAKNGSLDEALPNEYSFCVTALVAADVLAAYDNLKTYLTTEQAQYWLDTVRPMISFLKKQDEYHGFISNHLATAALSMYRWHHITNDKEAKVRGKVWLDRILNNQSLEGWYCEYGGPDPGYQTWCTTQLAQLYYLLKDDVLLQSLKKSLNFLVYAAHPDGSFGGNYGSRNTRFLLPGGLTMLSSDDANASALTRFSVEHLDNHRYVNLDSVDEGNLIPFFNDYVLAAIGYMNNQLFLKPSILPCFDNKNFRNYYSNSGWLVDRGKHHYTIINLNKGGSLVHFELNHKILDFSGFFWKNKKNHIFSTIKSQARLLENLDLNSNELICDFPITKISRPLPNPFNFLVLRLMSLTIFKSIFLGNTVKRFLSYCLIKRKTKYVGFIRKRFSLGPSVRVEVISSTKKEIMIAYGHFFAIHMASQGYWQNGDDLLCGKK
jgi:hypothetical protein